MLIEFSVENFRSFAEKQTLSMVASSGKEHPENKFEYGKTELLKSAAIFGANAAGKSNVISAMQVMSDFVKNSATSMNLGDPIPGIVPFRLSKQWRNRPSRFEVDVVYEGNRYVYGFAATQDRVHEEWLYEFPNARKKKVIERTYNDELDCYKWSYGQSLTLEEQRMLTERTRENGLVLSRGAELNVKAMKPVFLWFRNGCVPLILPIGRQWMLPHIAEDLRDNEEMLDRLGGLMRDADTGIESLQVKERQRTVRIPITDLLTGLDPQKTSQYYFVTTHKTVDSDEEVEFDMLSDESVGSQCFLALLGFLLYLAQGDTTILVDELDASLHPLLTRKLAQLIQSPEINNKGAQVVFATHCSDLMDQNLFRRDQIWFVEKNESGATELLSLHDYKPRDNEAFRRRYLDGRYGGVPQFGRTFEDLEYE